jgi:uncharacterized lipoprotein NlpE involved in copper resistance
MAMKKFAMLVMILGVLTFVVGCERRGQEGGGGAQQEAQKPAQEAQQAAGEAQKAAGEAQKAAEEAKPGEQPGEQKPAEQK